MLKRSVKKTTHEQFELLKFEMSKHPAAAIGYGVGTDRGKVDAEWRGIVVKLNEIGPPHRTVTEWKKVWSDVRLRMKKRLTEQYSGKSRKNRKRKDESESEEDFLMESLNNSSSIYATHSCPDNEEFDEPEIAHESYEPKSVNVKLEEYNVPPIRVDLVENNSPEEEETQKSVKKTTFEQFELLKFEMSRHPAAAMGYVVGTDRNKVDADWRGIVVKLNAIGPPQRSVTEWKKVWSDVRLRIKKRITEEYSRKNRKRKNEPESEEDLLMEALNNSIYASRSYADNGEYDEPEIVHEPCPSIGNVAAHELPGDNEEKSAANIENNPLEEEGNAVTMVENNPLEEEELTDGDSKKHFHRQFGISDQAESQYSSNNNDRNSFTEHTLYTLQSQMEQHNKLLEHLSRISASVSGLMERHVAVMERRTQLMERHAKTSEYNDFLRRRQETRKKIRGKTFEWF